VKTVEQPVVDNTVDDKKGTWKWSGAPDYKNERLAYYQAQLTKVGITDLEWHKWLSAQLIQENGQFTETRITYLDGKPCVFGLIQYNACGRNLMNVHRFWELYPEWKDWRYQLDQMANSVKSLSDEFSGEMSCVIVAHFHPNGANGARGLYKRNGHCKTHQYYHTHVAQRLPLLSL
jgi:hypothetical protein